MAGDDNHQRLVLKFLFLFLAPYFLDRDKMREDVTFSKEPPTTLICEAGGNPKPTIKWYKNGELVTANAGEISNDRSRFKIKSPDDGTTGYTCVMLNKYGNISFNFKLTVDGKFFYCLYILVPCCFLVGKIFS
jgi:hypothetical protein